MELDFDKELNALLNSFNEIKTKDDDLKYNHIFIDTNSFMIPIYFKFDIFSKLKELYGNKTKFIILDIVFKELKKILIENKIKRNDFRLILNLLNHNKENIYLFKTNEENLLDVDNLILKNIVGLNFNNKYLLTNDTNLRKKSFHKNIKVLYINNKSQIKEF